MIDTREQEPLPFNRLQSVSGALMSGDYSVRGLEELFTVERKSIADIIGCCMGENRERFARELHRLRGFRFKRLLTVGRESQILKGGYRSNIKPQAVMGTLLQRGCLSESNMVFDPSKEVRTTSQNEFLG